MFNSGKNMIHHNLSKYPTGIFYKDRNSKTTFRSYGVSRRIITPGLLLKRFDQVRQCLQQVLGFSACQREVVLRLLRLHAYYGLVYPKAGKITELPGCSHATFWRTIALLQSMGLVKVYNRYINREHAQISNAYILDKLLILLARYLKERGARLKFPGSDMDGSAFWAAIWDISSMPAIGGVQLKFELGQGAGL